MSTLIPDIELALARVLTERQTREVIGVSESTSERMKEASDYPPATQLSERRIGYRLVDVIAWLDARRRPDSFQKLGDEAARVIESTSADIRDHSIKMQRELNSRKGG
jgi:predicted DNA-binding transcriptional regulator AlpA